jgi:tight adherence protein B
MDQQLIIVGVLGLVCVGAVGFVAFAPTEKDKAKKRVQALEGS